MDNILFFIIPIVIPIAIITCITLVILDWWSRRKLDSAMEELGKKIKKLNLKD